MVGIENSQAILGAVKSLIEQYKLIMADGKLGIEDLKRLGPAYAALKEAKDKLPGAAIELKDLDANEVGELIMDLAEVAMAAYEALMSGPK